MAEETATIDPQLKDIGDQIANLTLKQAKALSDYIKDQYGIEPAAGGAVVAAVPGTAGGGAEAVSAEPTEFDVVLTGFGDKKLNVVKVVKNLTGTTLMDAKKLVESVPVTIKEKLAKEEAEKIKGELEEAGASVELK